MHRKISLRNSAAYGLLTLGAAIGTYKHLVIPTAPPTPGQVAYVTKSSALPARHPHTVAAQATAQHGGLLWDRHPGASPVQVLRPDTFAASATWQTADRVSLPLAPDQAPLDATVAYTGTCADGTRVTHLDIAGSPAGHLMLLEQPERQRFVGQLTYDGISTAYAFRKSGNDLLGERKELCDLICANDTGTERGLPALAEAPALPSLSVAPTASREGSANTFIVSLSSPTTATVRVSYRVIAGTAGTGDYRDKTGILTIRPNATSAKISIAGMQDKAAEADEQFTLLLSNPINATLGGEAAVATVVDDDSPASVRVFPAQMNEGASGARNMVFTVWLGHAAATDVTLDYNTVDGTAQAGTDYVATSGSLFIRRGRTSATLIVPLLGDNTAESDESFTVQLSNVQGVPVTLNAASGTIINDDVTQVATATPVPQFTSMPSAEGVIYLDFDGHTCSGTAWKNGATIETAGIYGVLGQAGAKEVWERFVEAFAPFRLNITTDESVYLNAPADKRIRCVVTPSNEWYSNSAGGVAYVGSFGWSDASPVWVFSDNLANSPAYIAKAGIHEVGHALGLDHDGSTGDGAYYLGHGSGATSWAPIMGYGLYRNVVQWSRGEYYQANQRQNDLAIIAANAGVGYVADEDDNTAATARPLGETAAGVIANANDVDVYQFTTHDGSTSIQARGSGKDTALDLCLELRDETGLVVASAAPNDALEASLSTNLPAGTYTLYLKGSGCGNPTSSTPTGYTDYGAVGRYLISSSIP